MNSKKYKSLRGPTYFRMYICLPKTKYYNINVYTSIV